MKKNGLRGGTRPSCLLPPKFTTALVHSLIVFGFRSYRMGMKDMVNNENHMKENM